MDQHDRSTLRLSDAERERALDHLRTCTAEGRLTLDEFAARTDAVYLAKTYGELDTVLADLPELGLEPPGTALSPVVEPQTHLEVRSASLRRDGDWQVPARLAVLAVSGSLLLDFSRARIEHAHVDIELDMMSSSVKMVLPPDGWADGSPELFAASLRNRAQRDPTTTGVSLTVHGQVRHSSVLIKRRKR